MYHQADLQVPPIAGQDTEHTAPYISLTATTIACTERQQVQLIPSCDSQLYLFGVEIETIATPHRIHVPLKPAIYYKEFAQALINRSLHARADNLKGKYRKHPEEYERGWWITRDPSLDGPNYPGIALEAVSPIMWTGSDWEKEVDDFWNAHRSVFRMAQRSDRCGSHVHISPSPAKQWTTAQLKDIAVGLIYYENHVQVMLPASRRDHPYCQRNTRSSPYLRQYYSRDYGWQDLVPAVAKLSKVEIVKLMQKDRWVLWNFIHIKQGGTGTVEFRGGRYLRDAVQTKRWITFALGYIDLLVRQALCTSGCLPVGVTVQELYNQIRESANSLSLGKHLPDDYRILNETKRVRNDDVEDSGDSDDSSVYDNVYSIFTEAASQMKPSWANTAKFKHSDGVRKVSDTSPATVKTVNVLRRLLRRTNRA